MFFRGFVILSLVIMFLSCDKKKVELPFYNIRINVLGKYSLKSFVLEDVSGRIFAGEQTISVSHGRLKISVSETGLTVSLENKNYFVQYFGLSSRSPFRIVFSNDRPARIYSGNLDVRENSGKLEIVVLLPVETYVAAAARAELGAALKKSTEGSVDSFRNELLSAMEIAIRSYVLGQKTRHKNQNYQFCDLTHCVHFPGIGKAQSENLTTGKVLVDSREQIVTAFFHSTCGGLLGGPEVYWHGHKSGGCFRTGDDRWNTGSEQSCVKSPHYRWHTSIIVNDMEKICAVKGIEYIKPQYIQRRISALRIGYNGERTTSVPISRFLSTAGRVLGWNVIKSNYFKIRKQGKKYILDGHGLGHGTGLCQWGARERAIKGSTCKEILEFYYPGSEIVQGMY